MRTELRNILFMDLAGWSKLSAPQLALYLRAALPKLADRIKVRGAQHINTWGDALIATFLSAKEAADCALDVRDFFRRTAEADGIPVGLTPRIALHVGEVIIAHNPLIERSDVFGHAVHLAARLEPVTGQGEVFCTSEFAAALESVRGIGPSAHVLGEVVLPKNFGTVRVFAVTGPNEAPPRNQFVPQGVPAIQPAAATEPLSDDEIAALLRVLLRSIVESCTLTYDQIIERCHALVSREAIMRVLPLAAKNFYWKVTVGRATVSFESETPPAIVVSNDRGPI